MGKIKQKVKNTILRFLPESISYEIIKRNVDEYNNLSFSQEGEDLILARFFEAKLKGFYIDIGAHHPIRFSNTNLFYVKGWRGINLDPNFDAIELFNKTRQYDKNLNYGVGEVEDKLKYFCFNEPALNTFSNEMKNNAIKAPQFFVTDEKMVEVKRLEDILDNFIRANQKIDFMNIDTEGFDLHVLKSNNWDKYRPTVVLVEDFDFSAYPFMQSPVSLFMSNVGYDFFAKTVLTIFFKDKHQNV